MTPLRLRHNFLVGPSRRKRVEWTSDSDWESLGCLIPTKKSKPKQRQEKKNKENRKAEKVKKKKRNIEIRGSPVDRHVV
jgi:hypothetical protein